MITRKRIIINKKAIPAFSVKGDPTTTAIDVWRKLHAGLQGMTHIRGNVGAMICLVAPPPTQAEMDRNTPFSDRHAVLFHEIMKENGVNTNDLFVITCSPGGVKPNKANTETANLFIKATAELGLFQGYISVGTDAFKFAFNTMKKPNMHSLIGHTVRPAVAFHKPVFIMPDLGPLILPPQEALDKLSRRDQNWLGEQRTRLFKQLAQLATDVKIEFRL